MILDATLRLEAALAASATSFQPEVHIVYCDFNSASEETRPATKRSALNNSLDVTLLDAPIGSPIRLIKNITVYNKDSAAVTCTIKTDDGSTERILVKKSLSASVSLVYIFDAGWQVV